MAEKGVAAVTGGVRDGWKASCRGDVLVPFDLQQLPLTFLLTGSIICHGAH